MIEFKSTLILSFVLFSLIHTSIVSQPEADLVHGILEGSGLKQYLNLSSCEIEVKSFVTNSLEVLHAVLSRNNVKLSSSLGEAFIAYSTLISNCKGTKDKINNLVILSEKIYSSPQQFMLDSLDKIVSLHVISDWWGLRGKIKDGKYFEVGVAIGDILAYVTNSDSYDVSTSPNKRFMASSMEITKCFDLLISMKSGFTMIFKTIYEMELSNLNIESVIDLVKDIKDFPKVCL